ncbi:hypothetical protein GGS20DRAFT_130399 [Poronia punctata]|nr:hypothetical protein GGS20DRAFT_130399 [Poronia punctata]
MVERLAHMDQSNHPTNALIDSAKTSYESSKPSSCTHNGSGTLRRRQWVRDHWIWELTSWFMSSLLLLGVVLTLSLHQNQPLPEWPFGVSINALISFLSSLSTSALVGVVASTIGQGGWAALTSAKRPLLQLQVYDDASRGPMGSFLFLLKTRLSLVSVGPLIIIASQATAPLVQQITNTQLTNDVVDVATILAPRNYTNLQLRLDSELDNPLSYTSRVVQGILYEDVTDTVKYGYTINADLLENDTYVFQTNYTSSQATMPQAYSKLNVSKWGSASLTDLIAQALTLDVWSWTDYVRIEEAAGSRRLLLDLPRNSPRYDSNVRGNGPELDHRRPLVPERRDDAAVGEGASIKRGTRFAGSLKLDRPPRRLTGRLVDLAVLYYRPDITPAAASLEIVGPGYCLFRRENSRARRGHHSPSTN